MVYLTVAWGLRQYHHHATDKPLTEHQEVKSMSLKSVIRRLSRAFAAKDSTAFDDALEELEEKVEDRSRDEPEDPIEIHNHMDGRDARGEMVEKDPPGFDGRAKDDEPPPWAKGIQDSLKKLGDDVSGLQKWMEEEKKEPEHQEDGNLENLGEHAEHDRRDRRDNEEREEESDRFADDRRRSRDEPAEREEMAERIAKEKQGKDEANQSILGELEFEAPPGTNVKDAKKTRDSAFLEDSLQDVVAKAEILAPGLRVPTYDRAAPPVRTLKSLLGLRRTALDLAYSQPVTRGVIDAAMGGRTLDTKRMSHSAVRVLFNSVASAVATDNNHRATDRSTVDQAGGLRTTGGAKIQSIADINRRNTERFGRKSA